MADHLPMELLIFSYALSSNAIIIPYYDKFVPPTWEKSICSDGYNSSTDLVLFLARELRGPEESIEAFESFSWDCFNNVLITSGNLNDKDNVYNKSGATEDPWWNRGPNFAFYKTLRYAQHKNYSNFFLMEVDTIPQKDNWLEELDFYFSLDNFYVLGGRITQELKQAWEDYGMPSYFINHINGNAIYNLDKPISKHMIEMFKDYAIECFACGNLGKRLFPAFLSSRLSFDTFFSYAYEFSGYAGYVADDDFLVNFAGAITSETSPSALFYHQHSGYEFAKAASFGILNLTNKENKNPCSYPLPSKPFFIVNDNEFNESKKIPTTDDVKYVLNALPRKSPYCKDQCLTETEFCKDSEDCFYIDTESIVFWPLDAYIECASSKTLPHGSEYITKHSSRYVLLDRSRVIIEHPVKLNFEHVPVIAASTGDNGSNNGLTSTEIGAIAGGTTGGVLLCGGLLYLCTRRRENEE